MNNPFDDAATMLDKIADQREIQQESIDDSIGAIFDAAIATADVDLPDAVFASLLNTADADIELDGHLAAAQARLVDGLINAAQDEIEDDLDDDEYWA